jgi:uncharacterized protein YceK
MKDLTLIVFAVLGVLSTGCASVRAREAEDPGHGGAREVLRKVALATEIACAPPAALRFVPGLLQEEE